MDYTEGPAVEGMPRNGTNAIPIIRLYGVTENGNSILCNVYGSLPYFYVRAPPKFTESHCTAFKTHLNVLNILVCS
jgi:DNA polymerase delta subunit 1